MTQLLVSVRNLDEAILAASAGADVIDIKQPSRGSLGAADADELREIVHGGLPAGLPLSAALGELLDPQPRLQPRDLVGLSYAKFGLAGCSHQADWAELWRSLIEQHPAGVAPVGVVYADSGAEAPSAQEVVAVAASAGAAVVLVDTFDKFSGGLLVHWSLKTVAQCMERVREEGLKIALAGSLDLSAIRQLLPLRPDLIAVRGAVCRGGRGGPLDPRLVQGLASRMKSESPSSTVCHESATSQN